MAAPFWLQNYWFPVILAAFVVGGYYYYDNKKKYWAKMGIKGVIPLPLIGEFCTMMMVDKLKLEKYRLKVYGKIYGTFMGGKARVLIADPEVLRQICIKDFDIFPNHQVNSWANKFQRQFLVWLQDDQWRRVRSLMSPTFTSGKIKRMFKFLDACADDLIALFGDRLAESDETKKNPEVLINLKETFDMFTMDGIATCCYGLKLKRRGANYNLSSIATRDDFLNSVMILFKWSYVRLLVMLIVPKSLLRRVGFEVAPEKEFQPLARRLEKLIEKRQKEPKKYDDLLQSLIDTKEGDQLELSESDQKENHHALLDDQNNMVNGQQATKRNDLHLSQLEIISEAMIILSAGFETTASLLTNCCYSLAFHPKVQEKLFDELSRIAQYNRDDDSISFEYDQLTSCNYLDSVISETLRMLPPAPVTDRIAKQDYFIEKYKVRIPKGSPVLLGLYAVQNDPDNWYKPDKFDPDRFMPGNRERIVPGSYVPFSMGPRHCIGMRFSLTEAKIGLAKTVMKFKFQPAAGNKFPPQTATRPGLVSLKCPTVLVSKRDPMTI